MASLPPNTRLALFELEMAFATKPSPEAAHALARMYLEAGRLVEALVVARRCIKLWPTDPTGHEMLCRVYQQKNHRAKVLQALEAVPAACPLSSELRALAAAFGHRFPRAAEPASPCAPPPAPGAPVTTQTTSAGHPLARSCAREALLRWLDQEETAPPQADSRARRTITMALSLLLFLGLHILRLWRIGVEREEVRQLVDQGRQAMAQDTGEGYRGAMRSFERALEKRDNVDGGRFRGSSGILRRVLDGCPTAQLGAGLRPQHSGRPPGASSGGRTGQSG